MGSLNHLSGFPLRQEVFEPNNKTIQKDKPVLTLASVSGGKDSTAMLLRLLEEGRQVDEILFCDTGLEFPQMYDHLEKLERYIGRPITRLKAPYTFEQYFYEYQAQGDAALVTNRGLSWPSPRLPLVYRPPQGPCHRQAPAGIETTISSCATHRHCGR